MDRTSTSVRFRGSHHRLTGHRIISRQFAFAEVGFPGEMEKFYTSEDMSDVDNPRALIYLHS